MCGNTYFDNGNLVDLFCGQPVYSYLNVISFS